MMKAANKVVMSAGILLLAGFCSTHASAAVVTLDVDNSSGSPRLVVTNNTAQCPGGPVDCIEIGVGNQPHMFFKLNKACQPGGAEYGLAEFYVMEREKDWPAPVNPSIASDFCADPATGEVNLSTCGNKAKDDQLKIKNFNRKPATVYYQVIAEHCTSGDTIELDPEIRNKGNGNN
jgi:hypothetical protein